TWCRLVRPFEKFSCRPCAFIQRLSLRWRASATARWEDLSVPLSDDVTVGTPLRLPTAFGIARHAYRCADYATKTLMNARFPPGETSATPTVLYPERGNQYYIVQQCCASMLIVIL